MKSQAIDSEQIFAKHVSDKRKTYPGYGKNSQNSNINNPILKLGKTLEQTLH